MILNLTRLLELADTIGGTLCPACRARFLGAAKGLVEICTKHAKKSQGGNAA